jgi:hypothetical protein
MADESGNIIGQQFRQEVVDPRLAPVFLPDCLVVIGCRGIRPT